VFYSKIIEHSKIYYSVRKYMNINMHEITDLP